MREDTKNIVKVACIYMTTIIGAGFASGQEIVKFFSYYNKGGFYGIILSGIMFSLIGYLVLDRVYKDRIKNYDELIFPMVGWVLGWVMEVTVTLFMLCLFCVMVAGMGNIISIRSDIPLSYSLIIVAFICMIIMLTDIRGIVAVSTIITPVLIVGILVTGFYIIIFRDTSVLSMNVMFKSVTDNWFFSALTYVSYNSIMSLVVMSSLLPYLKSPKTGTTAGVLGGLMLCFIALVINSAIYLFYPEILSKELPILGIIQKYSPGLTSVYAVVLWMAMFVSAVTSGFYFIERISRKFNLNIKLLTIIVCAIIIPLSGFGFSNLIATIYPIFGYVGMFMVFTVLLQGINIKRKPKIIVRKN